MARPPLPAALIASYVPRPPEEDMRLLAGALKVPRRCLALTCEQPVDLPHALTRMTVRVSLDWWDEEAARALTFEGATTILHSDLLDIRDQAEGIELSIARLRAAAEEGLRAAIIAHADRPELGDALIGVAEWMERAEISSKAVCATCHGRIARFGAIEHCLDCRPPEPTARLAVAPGETLRRGDLVEVGTDGLARRARAPTTAQFAVAAHVRPETAERYATVDATRPKGWATGPVRRGPVHADGGLCHGTPLVDGRCPGCGLVPDMQSIEMWPLDGQTR